MKTNICRSLLLLVLLPLLLTGCAAGQAEPGDSTGQTVNTDGPLPGEDGNVKFVEMTSGGQGKLFGLTMTENGLYAAFSRTPENTEEYPLYYLSAQKLEQFNTKYTFNETNVEIPLEHQPFRLFSNKETLYILASCAAEDADTFYLYSKDSTVY